MIAFTIPVAPVTKKNHQQIISIKGKPMVIPSKQYRQYEADCGYFLKPYKIGESMKFLWMITAASLLQWMVPEFYMTKKIRERKWK